MLIHFSHVQLSATLWNVALQSPLSMEFSRQEYWSRLPCPPPGNLPYPGIEPASLMFPALPGGFLPLAPPGKHKYVIYVYINIVKGANINIVLHIFLCMWMCIWVYIYFVYVGIYVGVCANQVDYKSMMMTK